MIWKITRSYEYDPDSVEEGERLYREAIAKAILDEINNKQNNKTLPKNDMTNEDLNNNDKR